MSLLKERRRTWLKGVTTRKAVDRQASWWRKLMVRMSSINLRTHRSYAHIGRNDACICGNVYAGTQLRGPGGNFVRNKEGEILEIPVKFKMCHMHEHIGLKKGEVTPEMKIAQKKQKAYFKKTGKVIS